MRSCIRWFEISTIESKWIYLELASPLNAVWSVILLYDSGRMPSEAFAIQLSRDAMIPSISEVEEYGSSWDDFGSSVSILVIASYIWDVGEAYLITPCEYVGYSGIVGTMPTYLLWPLGIWSGSLFCNLGSCGYWLTFGYCSERTTLALWLLETGH